MNVYKFQAPVKINLFLHVINKRNDGYHLLESLVSFCDITDEISISAAPMFNFEIEGPFGQGLEANNNLVVKAAHLVANYVNRPLDINVHLTKNIPLGAGLGGGSADAAAVVKGLIQYWDVDIPEKDLQNLLIQLGADVPVCYRGDSSIIRGIGEEIQPVEIPSNLATLLVYPNIQSSTAEVFSNYNDNFSQTIENIPSNLSDKKIFLEFIKVQKNDLSESAIINNSIIQTALNFLNQQNNCIISRMSGSGSTCFALFDTIKQAEQAQQNVIKEHPEWWVQTSLINKA